MIKGNLTILLTNLGNLALGRREFAQAREYYEEGLTIARATEDNYAIAPALVNLGDLQFKRTILRWVALHWRNIFGIIVFSF